MPLTDERANEEVWVRKGVVASLYHTKKPLPEDEFYLMRRGDAEALNLKPCDRCEFQ